MYVLYLRIMISHFSVSQKFCGIFVHKLYVLERNYIFYSYTSWGLSRLNTTNKILMLKVPIMGWPIVIVRPGIYTSPEGGGVDP